MLVASDCDRPVLRMADGRLTPEEVEKLGKALLSADREKVDGSLLTLSSSFELLFKVQEAKAAKCRGKQPCLDSLMPAASGYNSTNKRIKLQTSIKGSVVELYEAVLLPKDPDTEDLNLKHA